MRKTFALALVLVLAVAGASLAAEPSFSGKLKLELKSEGSFSGPFDFTPSGYVDADFAESGDNWSLDARLRAKWEGGSEVNFGLERYKGVLEAGMVTATMARNYDLGDVNSPLKWFTQPGNPDNGEDGDAKEYYDQLRLVSEVSGVQVHVQAVNETSSIDSLNLRAQADVTENVTLGAAAKLGLGGNESDFGVYGTTKVGIAEFKAIYGRVKDGKNHYAVDVSADVTEQLNVGATYSDVELGDTTVGYAVRGTFTEGLLQAKASYKEQARKTELWFKYRGSEGNQDFDVLFNESKDDWNDNWHTNVAPAFGVKYAAKEGEDSTVTVFGVAPFTSTAIGRAKVETGGSKTGFDVEARFSLSEKLVLNPYAKQKLDETETELGSKLIYEVTDSSKITVDASQKGNDQKLTATYELSF